MIKTNDVFAVIGNVLVNPNTSAGLNSKKLAIWSNVVEAFNAASSREPETVVRLCLFTVQFIMTYLAFFWFISF